MDSALLSVKVSNPDLRPTNKTLLVAPFRTACYSVYGNRSSKPGMATTVYKLCYYVPQSHLEATKQAVFDAGAGRIGDYDRCCWQVQGQGQFRPLPGSRPFLGQQGTTERIAEYRVEMVCSDEDVAEIVAALTQSHPYEEPAYYVVRLTDL